MNKQGDLAAAFMKQFQTQQGSIAPRGPINSFNALFAVQELQEHDSRAIERIFIDGYEPGFFSEEQVDADIVEIKKITKELKAIRKQEMVLIGERIFQAREIFKKYKDRSFRKWVELTFNSFKTGYNYLSFYELYSILPEELKDPFKEMPAKAAYILASKKCPIEKKVEIVKDHSRQSASHLISIIQDTFNEKILPSNPLSPVEKILSVLEKETGKIIFKQSQLDDSQKNRIRYLLEQLRAIV